MKKAELLGILEDLLQQQPAVNLYLAEKLSKKDGVDEMMARRIIRKAANRASRRGFIEWDRANDAVEGADEVQEYIDSLDPVQDGEKIIRLSLILIDKCSDMLEEADDSLGFIGMAINDGLETIREVMEQWPERLDEALADRMLELFYPSILHHLEQDMSDAPASLIESVMQWTGQGDYGNKIYAFIEKIVSSDAVEAFFQGHRGFSCIRKAEVGHAMGTGEFE